MDKIFIRFMLFVLEAIESEITLKDSSNSLEGSWITSQPSSSGVWLHSSFISSKDIPESVCIISSNNSSELREDFRTSMLFSNANTIKEVRKIKIEIEINIFPKDLENSFKIITFSFSFFSS